MVTAINYQDLHSTELRPQANRAPKVALYATNLHNPSHMEWTYDGRLLISEHTAGRVMEITEGGDMLDVQSFVSNLRGPSSTLPIGDPFLVAETWAGRVIDISGGGDFQPNNVFADGLVSPYSLAAISADEIAPPRIFSTERLSLFNGQITDISDGGSRESFRPYVTNVPVRPGKPGKTPLDAWPHGDVRPNFPPT